MKTLELENYGVVELSQDEKINIDGGLKWWQYIIVAGIIIGAFIVSLVNN